MAFASPAVPQLTHCISSVIDVKPFWDTVWDATTLYNGYFNVTALRPHDIWGIIA